MAEAAGKRKATGKAAKAKAGKVKASPAGPKAAARAAPAGAGAPADPGSGTDGVGTLRKKDLLQRVAAVTGGKAGAVKGPVEATLAILGEALARGMALNLPPLGKVKVTRSRGEGAGALLQLRLRRGGGKAGGAGAARAEPLAEPGEPG